MRLPHIIIRLCVLGITCAHSGTSIARELEALHLSVNVMESCPLTAEEVHNAVGEVLADSGLKQTPTWTMSEPLLRIQLVCSKDDESYNTDLEVKLTKYEASPAQKPYVGSPLTDIRSVGVDSDPASIRKSVRTMVESAINSYRDA